MTRRSTDQPAASESLANALRKLERGVEQIPMTNAGTSTAHMFFVNPLVGGE